MYRYGDVVEYPTDVGEEVVYRKGWIITVEFGTLESPPKLVIWPMDEHPGPMSTILFKQARFVEHGSQEELLTHASVWLRTIAAKWYGRPVVPWFVKPWLVWMTIPRFFHSIIMFWLNTYSSTVANIGLVVFILTFGCATFSLAYIIRCSIEYLLSTLNH